MSEDTGTNYASFQATLYFQGMFEDTTPKVTTNPNKLQQQAKEHLSDKSYAYVTGGAGEGTTMEANRLAFREWRLIPRMMRDCSERDISVNLFGVRYSTPILMAPIGVQSLFHEDAETGTAEIAGQLNIPLIMSSASTKTIEEVANSNGSDKPRWFQLYWPQTDEITLSILKRAKDNGFTTLVVTLDTFSLAWRPQDLDLGHLPFVKGVGNKVGLSDPVFRRILKEKTGKEVEDDIVAASVAWQMDAFAGKSHIWSKLQFLKENWDGPVVLKGIQSAEDALLAKDAGVHGIIVSNHGGRQLDGAIGSLTVLPEIVEAVGNDLTILFDSGIRTGTDIMKALALGAKAVLVGRPYIYGLSVNGKEGAKQIIQGLLADFDQSMMLSGFKSISEINPDIMRRVNYAWGRVDAL